MNDQKQEKMGTSRGEQTCAGDPSVTLRRLVH